MMRLFAFTICALLCQSASAASADAGVRSISGTFDDVRERVQLAIENRGLVVSYTARVGDMLARTGRDLGSSRPVYVNAEVLEFCSARYSAEAMSADPHSIVHCPYGIAVYVLVTDPTRVFVSYRRNAAPAASSMPALVAVDRLLSEIVDEALK